VPEKLFDGCYIVSGEVPKQKMAASEVVASYKKPSGSRSEDLNKQLEHRYDIRKAEETLHLSMGLDRMKVVITGE